MWTLLLLLSAVLLYLWVVGLPAEDLLRRSGLVIPGELSLEAGRLRLSPLGNVIVDDLALRETATEEVIASVERVILDVALADLLHGRLPAARQLELSGGNLLWPVGPPGPDAGHRIAVTNIQALVVLGRGVIQLARATACHAGLPVRISGQVISGGPSTNRPLDRVVSALAASRRMPHWMADVATEVERVRFSAEPSASLVFSIDGRSAGVHRARFAASGERTSVRGGIVDTWRVLATLDGPRIDIAELLLEARRGRLSASGWLDLAQGLTAFHVDSTLPSGQSIRWLPGAVQGALTSMNVRAEGSLHIAVAGGPAPPAEIAGHIRGTVNVERAYVRDVWVERGGATFYTTDEACIVTNASFVAGAKGRTGSLGLDLRYGWADRAWSGCLSADLDPRDAVSLMNHAQAEFTQRFEFPKEPPSFRGTFRLGPDGFLLDGRLQATNFMYNGVALDELDTTIACTGHVLRLDPWRVNRDGGWVQGFLHYHMATNHMVVDLASTMDATSVVDLVGPQLRKGLTWAVMEGPAAISARGVVDLRHGTATDLDVTVDATTGRLFGYPVDAALVQVHALGHRYEATNIQVKAFGGHVRGSVSVFPDETIRQSRFKGSFRAEDMVAAVALNAVRTNSPADANLGTLSGRVKLGGVAARGYENDLTAEGTLKLTDGELFRIPIFGGLSRYLSAIFPGVGFAKQNNLDVPFTIENGFVRSDEIMVEGSALSIRGRGYATIQGELSLDWQVQPLRSGGVAEVVRFVTSPVTKLFEFTLGGTMDEPTWEPKNLPKGMFFMFD